MHRSYASGTAIAARTREALAATPSAAQAPILLSLSGGIDKINSQHVIEAARRGDPIALKIWDETIAALVPAWSA